MCDYDTLCKGIVIALIVKGDGSDLAPLNKDIDDTQANVEEETELNINNDDASQVIDDTNQKIDDL